MAWTDEARRKAAETRRRRQKPEPPSGPGRPKAGARDALREAAQTDPRGALRVAAHRAPSAPPAPRQRSLASRLQRVAATLQRVDAVFAAQLMRLDRRGRG